MRIQLDTVNKTIRIENSVKLRELIDTLEGLLPEEEWKNFELKVENISVWTNPILILERPIPYTPPWWNQPWITYCTDDSKEVIPYSLNQGIFNVVL